MRMKSLFQLDILLANVTRLLRYPYEGVRSNANPRCIVNLCRKTCVTTERCSPTHTQWCIQHMAEEKSTTGFSSEDWVDVHISVMFGQLRMTKDAWWCPGVIQRDGAA